MSSALISLSYDGSGYDNNIEIVVDNQSTAGIVINFPGTYYENGFSTLYEFPVGITRLYYKIYGTDIYVGLIESDGGGASERENTTTSITADGETTTVDFDEVQVETLVFDDTLTTHTIAVTNLSTTERYNTIVIDNTSNTSGLTITLDDSSGTISFRNIKEFLSITSGINVPAESIVKIDLYNRSETIIEVGIYSINGSIIGDPGKIKKVNEAGDALEDTDYTYDQLLSIDAVDVSDIDAGESKILVVEKQEDGTATVGTAISQLDKLGSSTLDDLLAETADWDGDEITLTGDNTSGALGENGQEYYIGSDFFLCISHYEGTTTTDGTATWRRNRGQDCLTEGLTQDDLIIAELQSSDDWSDADFKTITNKSKQGTWWRDVTGGYLYMCIDSSNGWTRVGTPDTITLEITSTSHPTLTANLEAHDFATGCYLEGTDSSDEDAEQGQVYRDSNGNTYERFLSGYWAKTFNVGAYFKKIVTVSNAEIKALLATPIDLIAAPDSGIILLDSVVIKLNAGTEVLTEAGDNLAINYSGAIDIISDIEMTGFIDQLEDMIITAKSTNTLLDSASDLEAVAIQLYNNGTAEIAGNTTADATLTISLLYTII
ncbi:MAG: hypothetical protein PQJ44_05190 [Sphaerochaetaceae bacterium]|nr:hypothetical protein [Sphaerochaetaceae bacterium]